MKKLALLFVAVVPGLFALAQTQPLRGPYFTAQTLYAALKNRSAEPNARFYLIGAYDLAQETGQSCDFRGTTTPEQLEQVFVSYAKALWGDVDAHGIPRGGLAGHAGAAYAVKAFAEAWPCHWGIHPTPSQK